jgi:hypothetical protein
MMNLPAVDIVALHAAILDGIKGRFPTLLEVDHYPRPGEMIQTPAVYIELESFDADEPPNTGTMQLPVTLNFVAYAVCDYKLGSKLTVRTLAIALAAFINQQKWGQPVTAASVTHGGPDYMRAKLPQSSPEYEVMRVEWTHEALLNENIWIDEGTSPQFIFASGSLAPNTDVGLGNQAAYNQIA